MIFQDKFGNELAVGDKVLRAYRSGTIAAMELRTVERIENGKLYLDGAKGSNTYVFDRLVKVEVRGDKAVVVVPEAGLEPARPKAGGT